MMTRIGNQNLPLILSAVILGMLTPRATGLNYSVCAQTITNAFLENPNASILRDPHGVETHNLSNAWGTSYEMCRALCSTEDNASHSDYDWNFLGQGVGTWVLPWLALTAQLPFEARDTTSNLMALLLAVGSPSLLIYSLAVTILQARWTNRVFRQIVEKAGPLRRNSHISAIKAARAILMELQHVPIGVCNGTRREIAQLVVRPENGIWWCRLRQGILKTKRGWTYSLYAQVGFVCAAQLLGIICFFTSLSSDWSTSIGIGLAINCLWLWMIPVVLGWVYVGTQTKAGSVKVALKEATVPALGPDRNVSGDCYGIRDRTSFDGFDTSYQYSLAVDHDQDEGSLSRDSTLGQQGFLPDEDVTETISTLLQGQTSSKSAEYRNSVVAQPGGPAEPPDLSFTGQAGDIKMRKVSRDSHLSTVTTLPPIEQPREPLLDGDSSFRFLPETLLGFSIAGDELEPGPIFNYARPWTHANAVKHIAIAFNQYTVRQLRRQPVARGQRWDPDPENWTKNLQGSPEEYSKYINPQGKDVIDFSVHASASAALNFNCITAAFVAVFLQWGTTGGAIVVAFETPVVGLGCQSGSYLIYGLCSTVSWLLLTASAYLSHRYSLQLEAQKPPSPYLGPIAVPLRILGKTLAAANALFIVVNSFMQFTGLFDNCWCDACIPTLGKAKGWVILFATDVEIAAAGKAAWIGGVSLGMVVVALVTIWIFIASKTHASALIMATAVGTQISAGTHGQEQPQTATEPSAKAHSARISPEVFRTTFETANLPAWLEDCTNFRSVMEPGISVDAQSGAADEEILPTTRSQFQVDKSRSIINDATETLSVHHVSDQDVNSHTFSNLSLPAFRSEWQCHCGFKSFDDLTASQLDAVTEYQRSLQDCFSIHKIAPMGPVDQPASNGRSIMITVLENLRSWLRKDDELLPRQNKNTQPSGSLGWVPPSIAPAAANPQPLYLLLCIQHQRFTTKLLQPDLTGLHSDQDFFKLLRDDYHDTRGRWRRKFSLKTLRGIKFIHFELHHPDLVDVHKENELPPEERKAEYHYAPMPPTTMPPVGENLMLHFCTSPHCASERGILLDRIPKKLKERLRTCPTKGTGEGWGIYIQEDWYVGMIVILSFGVLLLGSLAFFICWSVLEHDLQGASGIAMYMMAFVALGIGSLQAAFEL